jgi:TetR/AcrR family transcriptional regulator
MEMKKADEVPAEGAPARRRARSPSAGAVVGRKKTAERIFAAADELFCARGFDGVSVGDIAERAAVNKALVFYHFDSKEQLFERVVGGYYEAHREALAHAFSAPGTLRERVHRMIDAYLDFIAKNRRYAALVQQEVADSEAHPFIRRHLQPLLEWTAKALSEITPNVGPLAGKHFFLTFSGATINFFTYGPLLEGAWGVDPRSDEAVEERRAHLHWLVDTLLAGLEAEAARAQP